MTSLNKNVSEKIAIVMLVKNTTTLVSSAINQLCKQSYSNWELFVICDENIGYVKEYEQLKNIITTKNINFEKIKTNHQYGYINHVLQTLNDEFSYFTIINSCDLFYPNYLKFMLNENKQFVYGNYHIKNNSTKQSKKYQDINDFIQNYHSLCFTLWSTKIINHLGELNLNTSDPLFDYFIRTFLSLDVSEYCYIHQALGTCFCEHKNKSYKRTQQQISVYKELLKDKDINDMLKCSLLMNKIPCDYHPLIIMPTYNRANNIEERINMIIDQTYDQWTFVIIDDGSTSENKAIFNNIKDKYAADKRIIFLENEINSKVAYTLNKGLQYFLENEHLSHLTWISDDNIYYNNYLFDLFAHNKDFVYSAYDILNTEDNSTSINYWKMIDFESLLVRFDGCASFMWSRNAIKKIGCYNEEIPGCEDYEYLLRTYKVLDIEDICFVDKTLMTFVRHPNQGTEKERDRIFTLKNEITKKFNSRIQQKVSIVMAYYSRKPQTLETLKGFEKMYAGKYNFEVVIVDDNSNEENRLEEDIKQFTFPINLIVISAEEKGDRINPCTAYNRGFAEATGDIIVIQNPECYHVGDILKHTLENLDEQDYFSYSCFTANSEEITDEMINSQNPKHMINNKSFLNRNIYDETTQMNWYNHPTDTAHGGRQTYYHFCSALYKNKLDLIGGFDTRFADGYCFDDDEFILSIKYNLKLNMKIIDPKSCFVVHQFHTKNESYCIHALTNDNLTKQKWLKNKKLYEELKFQHEKNNFQYPKLAFLYWDGSPLSYLNYLTVVSFNYYNPGWKIIVFMPIIKTDTISWKSHEQKVRYTGRDYRYKLNDIYNVSIQQINLDDIGFDNNASEVIKSDYFRYYIIEKHGGIWSDFDIIYTASIEEKMNFKENAIIFNCNSYQYPKNKEIGHVYDYYPIGLFISIPNNTFFGFIKSKCIENYDPLEYQSIGAVMFSKLFPTQEDCYKIDNVKICDYCYYLPWAWNELYEFYDKEYLNNKLPDNNIGIHWFNGADMSKDYANKLNKRLNNFYIECYLDTKIYNFIKYDREYNKKISIVIAYFNRKDQLLITLESIKKSNYLNKEIIIVDDNSREDQKVEAFINRFKGNLDIKVITITEKEKTWVNPCIPYNIGIKEAQGDIIVLQNPEVMHVGDCLDFINSNLEEKDWMSFNCYGSPNFNFNNELVHKTYNEIFEKINGIQFNIGGNSVVRDNVGGWLNHYENHFVGYHYLAAIHKSDINRYIHPGFNEIFKDGIGGDDDELIKRLIYNKFNFKISEFKSEKPFCIHLYHEKPQQLKELNYKDNVKYFVESCKNMKMTPQNDIALAPYSETPISRRIII